MYVVSIDEGAGFGVSGTTWQLPGGFVNQAALSACLQRRTTDLVARSPIDQLSFFCCRTGHVVADYDGISVVLTPGDIVFLDYMRSSESRCGLVDTASVIIPRAAMPARMRKGDLHGTVLRGSTAAGQMLGRHLDALVGLMEQLTVAQGDAALEAFVTLAAAVWPVPSAAASDAALTDRACAAMMAHIGDAALNPSQIAAMLGISRAMLYRLFEGEGGVSACIQRLRLDGSLKALIGSGGTAGAVRRVSSEFGFRDPAHFSRAFRARFGRSPSTIAALSSSDLGGQRFNSSLDQDDAPPIEALRRWLASAG